MEALRKLAAQLGRGRLAMMAGVAAVLLVALALVATRGGNDADMAYLFTDLDPSAAAAVSEKLKGQNVPFQLSPDGTAVLAPRDRLPELRMALAGERLSGRIGYDVLDAEEPFGISASRARINETRALEGELARSIETLEPVVRARVHIVMPERTMFATEARKASASVTLKTRGRLGGAAVQSIRALVASAVPELSAEAVTIVDQQGNLLARAGDAGSPGGADIDERQAATEARLQAEVLALLEPIVGQGKVRAQVSATLARDQERVDANVFDPDRQVIAQQITVEATGQDNEGNGGPRGVSVANQLPDAQAQAAGPGTQRQSAKNETSEDVRYQNSATRTVTVRAPGRIARLTVAVMVDAPKMPPAQVRKLQRLVENAVGFDADRGDSVAIEPMAFAAIDAPPDDVASWLSNLPTGQLWTLAKLLIVAAAGLIALRMLRSRPGEDTLALAAPAAPAAPTPEQIQLQALADSGDERAAQKLLLLESRGDAAALDQEIALAQIDGRIKMSAVQRIGDAVKDSPGEAAAVIRQWMNS